MNHEEHSTISRKLIEGLEHADLSRRGFLHLVGGLGAMIGMGGWARSASAADAPKDADGNVIPGFEKTEDDPNAAKVTLNGKDLGVLWCAPRRVDITEGSPNNSTSTRSR